MSPSVSIIVPVYNVEAYVEDCIRSVMRQTYTGSMECILVDDCGTDNSMAITARLIAEYQGPIDFKVLHHTHNRGLSAARNTGIDAATGDYLLFVDSDDELTDDCLETLVRPTQNDPTIEMVAGNHLLLCGGQIYRQIIHQGSQGEDVDSSNDVRRFFYLGRKPVSAWNKLIKKDFLTQNQLFFREGLRYEDCLWTFYFLKYLSHLYLVPQATYLHLIRPLSITAGTNIEDTVRHFSFVYEDIATHFTQGEEALEASFFVRGLCVYYYQAKDKQLFSKSIPLFKKALSDGHHTSERLLLSTVVIFSKTAGGRWLLSMFHSLTKAVNKVRLRRKLYN